MILLDLGQAAAELHCSERWLADNLRAGRFPAKKNQSQVGAIRGRHYRHSKDLLSEPHTSILCRFLR